LEPFGADFVAENKKTTALSFGKRVTVAFGNTFFVVEFCLSVI